MQFAFYYGDHKDDGFSARLGYGLIRLGQTGEVHSKYTHCEAILGRITGTDQVVIGSASVRDGNQVRLKAVRLNPSRWLVLDCPHFSLQQSLSWFVENRRTPYSMIGAMSSALWLPRFVLSLLNIAPESLGQWCSRALPDSVEVAGGASFNVAELVTLLMNIPETKDITREFFEGSVAIAEFPEHLTELLYYK